jgi:hypothetical protein
MLSNRIAIAGELRGRGTLCSGATVAQRTKKRARKRRNPGSAPRAVISARRDERAERTTTADRERRRASRQLGREGERPESPFGGLPISELAILAGLIGVVVGLINNGGPALIVGVIVCALGVVEITAREHFSGYRSHTILLAAIPAVGLEAAVVAAFGQPQPRALVLVVVVPVYALLFWLLRRRFLAARQSHVRRPAAPRG